ncbi:MAG: hypothetical protein AB7R69_03715 [Candidatus Babeliales bacterium]
MKIVQLFSIFFITCSLFAQDFEDFVVIGEGLNDFELVERGEIKEIKPVENIEDNFHTIDGTGEVTRYLLNLLKASDGNLYYDSYLEQWTNKALNRWFFISTKEISVGGSSDFSKEALSKSDCLNLITTIYDVEDTQQVYFKLVTAFKNDLASLQQQKSRGDDLDPYTKYCQEGNVVCFTTRYPLMEYQKLLNTK